MENSDSVICSLHILHSKITFIYGAIVTIPFKYKSLSSFLVHSPSFVLPFSIAKQAVDRGDF